MKKIMFHLHCLRKGGAERVVVNLAERFLKDGIEVCITIMEAAEDDYKISPQIRKIVAGIAPGEAAGYSRAGNFVRRVRNLRNVIREEKPDVIVAFGKSSNYRSVLAAMGQNIPVIVSVRNDPGVDYTGTAASLCNKLLMNHAAGCVFQTEEARSFFDEKLQKKSCIIWNPIHHKYIKAEKADMKERTVVTVGRMSEQKNQLLLLKAFQRTLKKYPDYQLKLYGGETPDGTRERLLEYVRENHMEQQVCFMGVRDDLEKELPKAAVFVMPSDYEGMPNALMEAMAMGLPVIATDCPCGGPRMLIQNGENGLLVPVGDELKMAEAILNLIEDRQLAAYLGENARNICKEADIETVYRKWKQYIDQIAG